MAVTSKRKNSPKARRNMKNDARKNSNARNTRKVRAVRMPAGAKKRITEQAKKQAQEQAEKQAREQATKTASKTLSGLGKAAIIIGLAAVMSGNQARRHERQNKLQGGPDNTSQNDNGPSPMPIQSSDMYHNETMELAASISSYRYGSRLPGYMT